MKPDILLSSYQQRRATEHLLADAVSRLLRHHPDEGLCWRGTNGDLIEALHVAHATGRLSDDEGRPLTFAAVVQRACAILHTPAPHNPYARAARARSRKGRRAATFTERCRLIVERQSTDALWEAIVGLSPCESQSPGSR